MKNLILMRHAKAEKDSVKASDFERDLEERGKKDALFMAQLLGKTKFIPAQIVASPANRTKQTASIVSKELKVKNLELDSNIYEADISDLMHVLREFDDQFKQILLVGHNPSITGIVGYLTQSFVEHIPTSGIVVVELPALTWKQIQNRTGKVLWHQSPKGLPIF
ncbi:MAG: SixA phosphatase family protein [Sediminibacterium sp.]